MKKETLIKQLTKDKYIALLFGLTPTTLSNYKKTGIYKYRIYKALKLQYIELLNSIDSEVLTNFKENQNLFENYLTNQNKFDNISI